jgi:energy-coupling factor transport system substrate-specific component
MISTASQTKSSQTMPIMTAAGVLIPLGVLINLGIGTIVHLLKLPVYIDAVGTIIVAILIGIRWGVVTGVLSVLIGGVLINSVMPYFAGTQAIIAVVAGLFAARGWFRWIPRAIVTGICIGVAAAIVSAPVIIKKFSGITEAGSSNITTFFLATGKKIVQSVILTGMSCEPVDKTIQCLLACWFIRALPLRFRDRLEPLGYLKSNRNP